MALYLIRNYEVFLYDYQSYTSVLFIYVHMSNTFYMLFIDK